jgi:hypothetical protein
VNVIKGLGEEIKEIVIVQKVLRYLPLRFDPKISALEERADLATLSMDDLHGILTAYEIRTEQDNPSRKEASFKSSKKTRKNKKNSKSNCSCSDDSVEDEEIANFIRKLKRGTRKYKGMIPLICLIVVKLVILWINVLMLRIHKVMKKNFPRNKINIKRETRKKRKFFKKSLYSNENSSSSD